MTTTTNGCGCDQLSHQQPKIRRIKSANKCYLYLVCPAASHPLNRPGQSTRKKSRKKEIDEGRGK